MSIWINETLEVHIERELGNDNTIYMDLSNRTFLIRFAHLIEKYTVEHWSLAFGFEILQEFIYVIIQIFTTCHL